MKRYLILFLLLAASAQAQKMDPRAQIKSGFPSSEKPAFPKEPETSAIGIAKTPKTAVAAPTIVDGSVDRAMTPDQLRLKLLCAELARKEEKDKQKKEHPECEQ
ncbi:hypothetical protein [Pseudoduganella sp. R-34]|uniref:hypothetical protein n=1 Tax=Pseudoduganella sp. R-34 TaxID=3404062 RepID=UPI003CE6CFC0